MELISGHSSFILVSELEVCNDSGGIFDANDKRLLAYFKHFAIKE